MNTSTVTFEHLGQVWRIFQRGRGGEGATDAQSTQDASAWYFMPRWGERGSDGKAKKVYHCFRNKQTKQPLDQAEAVAAAKALITAHFKSPDQWQKLRDATKLRATLTVGAILEQWVEAGYPEPNGRKRAEREAAHHAGLLTFLRQYYATVPVSAVDQPALVRYAKWRGSQTRKGYSGMRSVDRENNTLAQCFYWAMAAGLTDVNPFKDRPRFRSAKDVKHCSDYMPASDEELHQICGWLFQTGDPTNIIAGAQLLYMAMTGQRSGEVGFLRWSAKYTNSGPECGARFPRPASGQTPAGTLLAIHRTKGGIYPVTFLHPALTAFLAAWEPYCRRRWPESDYFFPHPTKKDRPLVIPYDSADPLGWRLEIAAKALGLPKRHPHGMRAVYVRTRRSEGASDSQIAEELGQSSGPGLIISTYGKADQIRYDGRWDWLPSVESQVPVAWTLLGAQRANIINL